MLRYKIISVCIKKIDQAINMKMKKYIVVIIECIFLYRNKGRFKHIDKNKNAYKI